MRRCISRAPGPVAIETTVALRRATGQRESGELPDRTAVHAASRGRMASLGGLGKFIGLFVVVMDHTAIGQRQIGQEMMRADHTPDREISHRRIDMRHQVQPAGPEPGAFDVDVGQIDRDQFGRLPHGRRRPESISD